MPAQVTFEVYAIKTKNITASQVGNKLYLIPTHCVEEDTSQKHILVKFEKMLKEILMSCHQKCPFDKCGY